MRLLSGILFCIVGAGLVAPEMVRRSADRVAERRVAAAIARVPGLHAGRVRARGGAAEIEVDGVEAAGRGWRIAADRLVLPGRGTPGPSFIAPALARPAAAAADNVTLTLGSTRLVIPHVEARGTDLSPQDLSALLDPAAPLTLAERLAKLTAAQISAPMVVLGSPGIPDPSAGDHMTLKGVSITDVGAGRIGALAIAGVNVSSPSSAAVPKPPMTVLFETGRIEVDGIDLPLALAMATGSRAEAATSLQPVLRSVSIDGVVLRPDVDTAFQIGTVLAGALRVRPLTLPPSDVMVLAGKPAPERTAADRQILSDLVTDAAGSAAFDHLEIRDLAVTKPRGDQLSFTLRRAALDGFDVVKLGSLVMEDAALTAGFVDVSLGRFVLGGYDGSGLIGLLKSQIAEGTAPSAAQIVPSRTSLALAGLHVAFPVTPAGTGPTDPSKRVSVDVAVASVGGGIDAATGSAASRASVEMAYDVSAAASDPSYRDLIQYGMSRLDFGADYSVSFDPAAKRLTLEHLSFDAENLGHLAVAAALGNASLDMVQGGQDADKALEAAQNLVFQSFSLVFVNTGIVEKILPPLAASAKVSVPLLKAQLKAQAEIAIGQALGTTPVSSRIVAALRTFIDTPKTLAVLIKAPAGLSFGTAASTADPKALLGAVDIQVTANR